MKNISKYQLKKCIFMTFEEYQELILDVTDGLKEPWHDFDGFWHDDTDKAYETGVFHNEEMTDVLSKYFDTKVTSIHMDNDSDCLGIWICYKEE